MLKVKEGTGSGIAYCILLLLMIIFAFFNDAWRIVMYIVGIPLLLYIPSFFKELQMSKDGCLIRCFSGNASIAGMPLRQYDFSILVNVAAVTTAMRPIFLKAFCSVRAGSPNTLSRWIRLLIFSCATH